MLKLLLNRTRSQIRPLDEEQKSRSNETGNFPFGRESDDATFARASKEKSIPHTADEGRSQEGTSVC